MGGETVVTGKLPASSLASLGVSIFNGLVVIFSGGLVFTGQGLVDVTVYLTLLVNVLFFYYIEVCTEIDPAEQLRLASAPRIEWYIRILNQCLLSVIVFWFGAKAFANFFIAFIAFYIILLIWDRIVYGPYIGKLLRWRGKDLNPVIAYDLRGLLYTFILAFVVLSEKISKGYDIPYLSQGIMASARALINNWILPDTAIAFIAAFLILFQWRNMRNAVGKMHLKPSVLFKMLFYKQCMA
jgi:hypothetical protein